MAATITEEVKAMFTGDASGLIATGKKADQVLEANARKEKFVSDYVKKLRKDQERDAALAPIRAEQAAKKKAEAEIKAAQDASEKILRQRKASSASNIANELRSNFGGNAKRKIGGVLQHSLGLSEDAAEGLVGKIGKFAPYLTAAGAAAGLLVKSFTAGRDLANQQAEKMHDLSEEMFRASRVNVFASSTDGASSLSAAAEEARQRVIAANKALYDNEETEQGGNIVSRGFNSMVRGASKGILQFGADIGIDTGPESAMDKQAREKRNLELGIRASEQDQRKNSGLRTQGINQELILTRSRLTLDQQTVSIQNLQLQKEAAIVALRRDSRGAASKQDIDRTGMRFDMQIQQQKELQSAMEGRQNLQMQILGLANQGMTAEQQSVAAARMKNEEIEEELSNRKLLTTEEKRAFELERAANQNAIREAQIAQVMKSPAQQNREIIAQRRREVRIAQAGDRLNRTDGLRNIERDISGNIAGGIDAVTGLRRGVSANFLQPGGGLSDTIGGLSANNNGSLDRPKFTPPNYAGIQQDASHGSNDQSAGNTLMTAARAQVEATNISNDYLKQIQIDMTTLASNYGFQ